ncbi:hypothetical protein OG455_00595 [Kitasatospora sp. NBC_01287]|uniref:hypothetical protein n=1 Tax=Kitasatospora sp. NBC_01287 TaxID=2903573 RepID=UPI0022568C8C|nr:hypothetical protein [Kitasatospora sp. NBC_01287]MCX4744024.1 hypothetical protein [Kitasatospora sp. NBC_01287]
MDKSVDFNPASHPGLAWSVASYSHLDDTVECFAVADAGDGLVALANINNDGAVVTGTPGELRKLRDAFAAGQYDHLIGA